VLFKWILYLALAVLVAWRYGRIAPSCLAALRDFRQMLADFWNKLFGGKAREASRSRRKKPAKLARCRGLPIHDPFAAGMAGRYRPEELVRYTFEALEAWARDNGHSRLPDQTPHEFARCLAGEVSSWATTPDCWPTCTARWPTPTARRRRQVSLDCRSCGRNASSDCSIVRSPAFRRRFREENRLKPELRTTPQFFLPPRRPHCNFLSCGVS